jgi:hypothetical protein
MRHKYLLFSLILLSSASISTGFGNWGTGGKNQITAINGTDSYSGYDIYTGDPNDMSWGTPKSTEEQEIISEYLSNGVLRGHVFEMRGKISNGYTQDVILSPLWIIVQNFEDVEYIRTAYLETSQTGGGTIPIYMPSYRNVLSGIRLYQVNNCYSVQNGNLYHYRNITLQIAKCWPERNFNSEEWPIYYHGTGYLLRHHSFYVGTSRYYQISRFDENYVDVPDPGELIVTWDSVVRLSDNVDSNSLAVC